jgi:hypothetical protein
MELDLAIHGLSSKRASPELHHCVEDWQRPLSSSSIDCENGSAGEFATARRSQNADREIGAARLVNAIHVGCITLVAS